MTMRYKTLLFVTLLTIAACSDDKGTTGEHVWKEQTDTIKKVEQVETILMESAEQQKRSIEQTQ